MDIQINRESDVPIHEQVSAQIVFLIGTGKWASGTDLPSARSLSQRLGLHRNTITKAFEDLILKLLVEKRPGRRLTIRGGQPKILGRERSMDDLLNTMIEEAGRLGYSLQELQGRLKNRLYAAPADHLLVVSEDNGMRALYLNELRGCCKCQMESCTPGELVTNPERGIGALVVSPPGHIPKLKPVLGPGRLPVPLTYSAADTLVEEIRRLRKPSLIAIVSISEYFLGIARGVLAAAAGRKHSINTYLMTDSQATKPGAADLVCCDSLTYPVICLRYKPGVVFEYRLISPASLRQISCLVASPSR